MATWPANGDENWNTAMLAYLAVEHETDGTHDLVDMGWLPAVADNNTESMTTPVGVIIKFGRDTTLTGNLTTPTSVSVAYDVAFPNTTFAVIPILRDLQTGGNFGGTVVSTLRSASDSGFTIDFRESVSATQIMDGFYWIAIGR